MIQPGPAAAISDVVCLENMLDRGQWQTVEVSFIRRNISILKEAALAGLVKVPAEAKEKLAEIDPLLRARWDFVTDMWAIERWVDEEGFCRWELIAHRYHLDNRLYRDLRAGDTWRGGRSPEDILRERREAASEIRRRNEATGTDKVLEAVDSLSHKQRQEFIDVENAVASGEKIVCHGAMEKFIDRQAAASPAAPDIPHGQGEGNRFRVIDRRRPFARGE